MQRQLDNLRCSLTRLSRPLHPGIKHTTDYIPIMPNPTGPTALPPMPVGAALPVVMVEDVVLLSR